MSKVYETSGHAYPERELVPKVKRVPPDENVERGVVVVPQGLPPLQMVKEMERLYQSITALSSNSKKNILLFVCSRKDEGSSTVLREFGRFLSEKLNKSILLVDADSSQLDQHQAFSLQAGIPIQKIVNEGGSVDRAILRVKSSSLFLCRLLVDNSVSFQHDHSKCPEEIWNRLRKQFDYILIDSPPIGTSEEALALCSTVDGVILVVEAEKTRLQVVSNMKDRIIQNGGNILGVVFNKQRYYIPEWVYKRI